jgi:type I restriction enzyme S subunit
MGKRKILGLDLGSNSIGWALVEWNTVLTIVNGKNQRAVENSHGQYPIYGSGGVMSYADDYLCPENTTIVGRKGTINKPILVREKFWNVDTAFGLVAGEKLDSFYLNYFCQFFDFTTLNKSTTLPSLAKRDLNEIKMPLPPLSEQQRIVAKLDALFANIDKAISLIEENIAHTQALMGSVLDEEFGKLDCKSHLLKKISDKIQYGYTGKTKEKGEFYYLRITDIQDGKVNFVKAPFSDISNDEAQKYILNQGDILFARTGATAGKSYLFIDEEPSIFASYLIRVVVNQKLLSPSFLKWYFQSDEYWNQIFGNIVGAAQPNFNGKKLGELNIPVPNLEIQNKCVLKFEQYDKVIRSSIETQTQKLNNLKSLKSSLLDQAFRGEL